MRAILGSLAAAAAILAVGCGQPAIEQLTEARRLTSELLVQFNKASDATDRVVMAASEDASASFAKQAEQAHAAVEQHSETLRSLLAALRLTDESERLDRFVLCYDESRALDLKVRTWALENTNSKAQQLAFGPAHDAANAFATAVQELARTAPAPASWQARALAMTAIAAVREIQLLQARHIPEDEESVMSQLENEMNDAEKVTKDSLDGLAQLPSPAARGQVARASAALDRFMAVTAEIVGLSRRNSNVHALALALGDKGKLAAKCETELRGLQDALGKRGFSGTR